MKNNIVNKIILILMLVSLVYISSCKEDNNYMNIVNIECVDNIYLKIVDDNINEVNIEDYLDTNTSYNIYVNDELQTSSNIIAISEGNNYVKVVSNNNTYTLNFKKLNNYTIQTKTTNGELINEFIVKEGQTLASFTSFLNFEAPSTSNVVDVKEDNEKAVITITNKNISQVSWKVIDTDFVVDNNTVIQNDLVLVPLYSFNETKTEIICNYFFYPVDITINNDYEDIYVLPTPTNEMYDFVGWYETNGQKKYSYIVITDDDTTYDLTARWTINLEALEKKDKEVAKKFDESVKSFYNKVESNNLTLDDFIALSSIVNEYDKLTSSQKVYVESDEVYQELLSIYPTLEEANNIYTKIQELGSDVEIDSLPLIRQLKNNYEDLDEDYKYLVTNYDHLETVEDELNKKYEYVIKQCEQLDNLCMQVSYIFNYYDIAKVTEIIHDYSTLSDYAKTILVTRGKIESLMSQFSVFSQQKEIYIMNTSQRVFKSRSELSRSFFSDFYYFIVLNYGTEHLEENGINDYDTFMLLANSFDWKGTSNMYGIGNIAGRYLLQKDVNGIVENQSDKYFFGYCHQNDLYKEQIAFFTRFFAYWRIDEGYAKTTNYGADIYAESWAPTVDIGKFFYYDSSTSYVKSKRMLDCFDNCEGVYYFDNPSDKNTVRLRGYKFVKYDILDLSNVGDDTKVYVAVWEEDTERINRDNAEMVDIYIYNLTTSKAVVNETTITYVVDMYNNLSEDAKSYVTNYEILQTYMNEYLS